MWLLLNKLLLQDYWFLKKLMLIAVFKVPCIYDSLCVDYIQGLCFIWQLLFYRAGCVAQVFDSVGVCLKVQQKWLKPWLEEEKDDCAWSSLVLLNLNLPLRCCVCGKLLSLTNFCFWICGIWMPSKPQVLKQPLLSHLIPKTFLFLKNLLFWLVCMSCFTVPPKMIKECNWEVS